MTIEELRRAKAELEGKIAYLIHAFQREADVAVSCVDVHMVNISTLAITHFSLSKVSVQTEL